MKTLNKIRFIPLLLTLLLVFMMLVPAESTAQGSVNLGTAANFAVLAGSTITNTGSSVITGDLGLYPGSAVTGFPPGILNGTAYVSDGPGVASKAKTDLQTAYDEATAATYTAVYGLAADIGGETFSPGVYSFPTSVEITGPVTLNGSASDIFIFQIGTTLTTASSSSVILGGSVNPDNVFWQVGQSATLGTSSTFKGSILAEDSITGTTGATVIGGRLLAITGAVTLDTNTITNPIPTPAPTPDLNVIKVVSGGAASPSAFLIHVKTAGASGSDVVGSPQYGSNSGTAYTLDPSGTYVVSEDASAASAGYTASYSSGGSVIGTSASSGPITLVSGVLKTVTITNTYATTAPGSSTAALHVIKDVVGGTAVAADFNLHVKTSGSDVAGSPEPGVVSPGTPYTLAPGTYTVSEVASAEYPGYTESFSGDSDSSGNITLASGDNKTVTITNTYTKTAPGSTTATLTVIKDVIGGAEDAADFEMHVTSSGTDVAGSPALGAGSPGTTYTLAPGPYAVSETAAAGFTDSGYTATYSSSDPDSSGGNITLVSGENATVTITNTYTPTSVSNGGGGGHSYYSPLINVVKIPSPLVLPAAGGTVTYTYTVTNPGDVALSNVSVTDNKVSPVTYVSGDVNGDNLLEPGETWIYTGTANLAATTTDTATATGSANGLTTTDIAYATVVVTPPGSSNGGGGGNAYYPPLINVVKIPSPLVLPAAGGTVTYTYTVTNPGDVALSNVSVTDNEVSPVTYVSGDVNGDNLLEPGETWIYTGTANLNATTTDSATATGSANGLTATHIAYATVVVTPTAVGTPAGPGGKVVARTVTGGQLPKTATPFSAPMYELLLIGAVLTLAGAAGWKSRKRHE